LTAASQPGGSAGGRSREYPGQPTPAPKGASPLPYGAHRNGTAQRTARAEPETDSLGYSSITYTPPETPKKEIHVSDTIRNTWKSGSLLLVPHAGLIRKFYDHVKLTEQYWISIRTIKPNCKCTPGKYWGYDHHARRLNNRWSHPRRLLKVGRMYEIGRYEESLGGTEFTLLTLTDQHNTEDYANGWYDSMERLCVGRGRLLKHVRKCIPGVRYCWVVEPHPASGFPHIHLMVAARVDNSVTDPSGRGLEDKLRALWSEEWKIGSHTFGLDFEPMDSPDMALNYMLKYIGKSFADERGWGPAELIFNAHIYGAIHERGEDLAKCYRTFGMCNEYNRLFSREEKEPSVTLDVQLFPLDESADLPQKCCIKDGPRPQLIPDWLGNVNLISSINAGCPDYTARFECDRAGRQLPRPSSHWGRPLGVRV